MGPLPAACPPPLPYGSRRSRRLARPPIHSPGARPEAAPGQDRGDWCWWPQQHLPQSGQGSPSQNAPGSAACWPRGPLPAHLPPVPSHSDYPSPRWVREPVALSAGGSVLSHGTSSHRAGPWQAGHSRRDSEGAHRWTEVPQSPVLSLVEPQAPWLLSVRGETGRTGSQVPSTCPGVCSSLCSSLSSQHRHRRWLP